MYKRNVGIYAVLTILLTNAWCDSLESINEDDPKSINRRFLMDINSVASNMSIEQFASCYLTCVSSYDKLLETCCQTGLSVVCSNLPWDILKPRLGTCTGLVKQPPSTAYLMSTKKLTTSSPNTTSMTSPLTTPTTTPHPYWLPWGSWVCEKQGTSCYQRRLRNCSTGTDNDCIQIHGGIQYNVGLCTKPTCPSPYFGIYIFTVNIYSVREQHSKVAIKIGKFWMTVDTA